MIPENIRSIFENSKTIAVCGMSRSSHKAAHSVPAYLKSQGFTIIPINPFADEILGLKVYRDIMDVPDRIDVLNVFRPSNEAADVVRNALQRREHRGDVDVIWLQLGIRSEEARQLAEEAGITFVQDRCMYVDYTREFV